jgi:hypothetical protein
VVNKKSTKPVSGGIVSRIILVFGVSLILIAAGCCGYKVHTLSVKQEGLMRDYSLINSVSFGLLSVDVWRDQIVTAATAKINEYRLSPSQQADLKKEIEQLLRGLVDHAFNLINKPQKSLGGKVKKLAVNALVNKKKVDDEVPGFADKIMAEINKPSSYKRLDNIADTALAQMGRETYDSSMVATKSTMDSVFSKYHVTDKDAFEKANAAQQAQIRRTTYDYAFGMLGCILLILAIWFLVKNKPNMHVPLYIMSVISALILLVVGLTTTMIEIDARIKQMDFHLLGQDISFKNQVLFFQSKSIVDVVILLLKTGKIDSGIVGVLILVFSIIFPITKLTSTGIYLLSDKKWSKNKVIHYFAFESGKWSMADVMVVALLMTYIGFNGIVESTLSDLTLNNSTITSITTNKTSMQPGYIVFVGFVLYGFVLSAILKKITHDDEISGRGKI